MFCLKLAAVVVFAYLLGSLSFSIIASELLGKGDLRKKGSGNAGLTNAIRTGGTWVAILTLVGDSLKGILSVLAAKWFMCGDATPNALNWAAFAAATAVVLGHIFPVFFRFRGGKGVLTSASVVAVLDWRAFLVLIGAFAVVFLISGIVSIGSLTAAVLLPGVTMVFMFESFGYSIIFMTVLAVVIIIGHRENITRIFNGTEKKLFHKKEQE